MKAPMILPWIAKKAGISEALALKLWRRAASETELQLGTSEGREYHRLASEYFLILIDDESVACSSQFISPFIRSWWQQQRLSRLSMQAAQHAWRDWQQVWGRSLNPEWRNIPSQGKAA